jgi:hypothetical protein
MTGTKLVLLLAVICALASVTYARDLSEGDRPTTRHLKEVFLGRCFLDTEHKCDCYLLWDMFFNITAFRAPEEVTPDDYEVRAFSPLYRICCHE